MLYWALLEFLNQLKCAFAYVYTCTVPRKACKVNVHHVWMYGLVGAVCLQIFQADEETDASKRPRKYIYLKCT